jgi:hypothetical protein
MNASSSPVIDFQEVGNDLIMNNLSIIPVIGKSPAGKWKEFQSRLPSIDELVYDEGIALVCGNVSGGVECIDVDVKNDPSGTLMARLREALWECASIPFDDLVLQGTPSKGCHIIFKSSESEGNQVLAKTTDQKVLIETRGNGGYCVIAPSPGYELVHGDFKNIPIITPDQRESLFTICRSLNEYFEEVQPNVQKEWTVTSTGSLTSWEDFNKKGDVPELLQENGWSYLYTNGENAHYCRPGKVGETSATWSEARRLLHVFTTSTSFEGGKAYSPTAIFAYLKCEKDFSIATKMLGKEGFGKQMIIAPSSSICYHDKSRSPIVSFFRPTNVTLTTPPKKLFGSLWAEGEMAYLFAEDGAGKSILAVQIAQSIATGMPIKGFDLEIDPQPVLLIDTELSDYQFNARYPHGVPGNVNRRTFEENQQVALYKAELELVVEQIENEARAINAKVIMLDNLSALTSMVDLTKTEYSIRLMGLFNEVKRRGFSLLIIDHTKKPFKEGNFKPISKHDLQGSKMKSNLADSAFSIGMSCQGEKIRYVKALKIRSFDFDYGAKSVATIELLKNPLRFEYLGRAAEYEHVDDRSCQMLRMVDEGKTQQEIGTRFGIKQQAVSKQLAKLADEGFPF